MSDKIARNDRTYLRRPLILEIIPRLSERGEAKRRPDDNHNEGDTKQCWISSEKLIQMARSDRI